MTPRKIAIGFLWLLCGVGLLAGGYRWGQKQTTNEHASPQGQSTEAGMDGMTGMKGMEGAGSDKMSSGSVTVSPEKQQLVGIRTAVVEMRPLVKKIRTVGIVTYDETRVAQVFTKVEGWIDKLYVNSPASWSKKDNRCLLFTALTWLPLKTNIYLRYGPKNRWPPVL